MTRVVPQESDHHFVAYFGAEEGASLAPRIERGETRPDAFFYLADQRQPHLDAVFSQRVLFQDRDDPHLQPAYRRQ